MSDYIILPMDCRRAMSIMAPQSIHTVVTSPPYFGLRDYGCDGQLGLEPTPDEFVAALVEVFRSVRRVLRDDGTVWLNLGDSYASKATGSLGGKIALGGGQSNQAAALSRPDKSGFGLVEKQLIGIPWRVAFALQADGWYLRQDIIWHKPNPMPESVRDRCTKAHEYIFLLSKSPKYYFDSMAVREPIAESTKKAYGEKGRARSENSRGAAAERNDYNPDAKGDSTFGFSTDGKRNRRSVWTVTTKPFKGAHFATFPPDLIEPCVLAGCPEGGTVFDPFGGSGTTALVALRNRRKAVLSELNPEYVDMAHARMAAQGYV